MKRIQVLRKGRPKCQKLAQAAAQASGIEHQHEKVTERPNLSAAH